MGRRRELHDVADGILKTFVSRNNDIDGYWALGVLYRKAVQLRTRDVKLDLLRGDTKPNSRAGREVARRHRDKLLHLIGRKGLAPSLVQSAELMIEFDARASSNERLRQTYGDPFIARLILIDDHGRHYSAEQAGWCAPHDGRRELRSTRAQPWWKRVLQLARMR